MLVLLEAMGFVCARAPFCEAETRPGGAGASLPAPGKHTEPIRSWSSGCGKARGGLMGLGGGGDQTGGGAAISPCAGSSTLAPG